MENDINVKFNSSLPKIECVAKELSSITGVKIEINEKERPVFSEKELIEFGLTKELAKQYKEQTKSYFLVGKEIPYKLLLIYDEKRGNITITGVSLYRKYYFEGALLVAFKNLGGTFFDEIKDMVAEYSFKPLKEASKYNDFQK